MNYKMLPPASCFYLTASLLRICHCILNESTSDCTITKRTFFFVDVASRLPPQMDVRVGLPALSVSKKFDLHLWTCSPYAFLILDFDTGFLNETGLASRYVPVHRLTARLLW